MSDDSYVQEIRYVADIRDIQSKLDTLASAQEGAEGKTRTETGKMARSWNGVKDAMGKVAIGVGLLGGAAIVAAPKILEAGAGLEGLDQKAKTVFGDSLGTVNAWAAANAASMGLTESKARDAAASMADLLKPMGFTAEQAAGMSTSMIDLSGALSAWTGGTRTAAEVSEILSKAMLGERDGLKELGISISEADVQARLAANGTAGLTGAALEQAKALATQQLILEKSTDAQTAWSDGSMDAAKKQNEMKAATAGVGESLTRALYPAIQGILPVVTTFATWFGENAPGAIATLREAISNVSDWFAEHTPVMIATAVGLGAVLVGLFTAWAVAATAAAAPFIAIGAAVAAVAAAVVYAYQNWEGFRNVVNTVKDFIVNDLVPAFQQIWSFISDNIIPILQVLVETYIKAVLTYFGFLRDAIVNVVIPAFMAIASTIASVATTVGTVVGNIVGFVTGIPGRISATVSGLWDGLKTGITTAKDWISGRIDDIVDFVTGIPGRVSTAVSDAFGAIPRAFRSAINGIIDAWNNLSFRIKGGPWDPLGSFGPSIPAVNFGFDTPTIPRLAAGGLAYSPTLAIVGDNRNARTDPEVIAPLSKLTEMLRSSGLGGLGSGPITLIIEGRPFSAIIASHETAQVAELKAGMR